MKDPLSGKRRKIARKEVSVLVWPAVDEDGVLLPAPVAKGDRFRVHGVPEIMIESCNRKLPAGKPAEWHATFVRHEVDRPQFLRRVPSGLPTSSDRSDGRSDVERARVESAYTSSMRMAIVDEPESVGPDWIDTGAAQRTKQRHEARQEMEAERLSNNARARLGRVLSGLTLDQRIQLLAYIEKGCEMAESGELHDAA